MVLKENEPPFSPSRIPWQHRRLQRCVVFAVIVVVILIAALSQQKQFITDLHLDTITGLHRYTSAPEAGKPAVPYDDNSEYKADPAPIFEVPGGETQQDDAADTKLPTVPGELDEDADTSSAEEGDEEALSVLDPTKVALLMDTRVVPHMPALLAHFIAVLPPDWTVRFAGSPESLEFVKSSIALQSFVEAGKLVLGLIPKQYSVNSQEAISATLTDLSFYKEFLAPAEWLLVFQTDSIICAASEHSIEEWVGKNYTWVGAPWHMGNEYGGNGGLSLRHLPPIIELLEKEKRVAESEWEDRWLCDRLGETPGTNMAPPAVERFFSVEGIWADRPFGYHLRGSGKALASDVWGNATRRQEIYKYCPEIKIVLDMDLQGQLDQKQQELEKVQTEVDKLRQQVGHDTAEGAE